MGELEYVDQAACQGSACVRLPVEDIATRCVASVALHTMSRNQLTKAIETCNRYAHLASSYGFGDPGTKVADDWLLASEAFRFERRRRYR